MSHDRDITPEPPRWRIKRWLERALFSPRALPLTNRLLAGVLRAKNLLLNVNNDPRNNGEWWFSRHFAAGTMFLDVGFNVGAWSDQMLRVAPQATIHAFDPDRAVAQRARARVEPRLSFHEVALSSKDGIGQFTDAGPANPSNSLVRPHFEANGAPFSTFEVTVRSLDSWAKEHGVTHIDLLKVDAEGHDLEVLQGAEGLFAGQAIAACVFEYDYAWLEVGHLLVEAVRFFERHGYQVFRLFPHFLVPLHWQRTHENLLSGEFVALSPGALSMGIPTRALRL